MIEALTTLPQYDHNVGLSILAIIPLNIPAQGVEYDVVVRPEIYGRSYIQLAALYEFNGMKKFNAIPISHSLIPRHIEVDTTILCHHLLNIHSDLEISELKNVYWNSVFNLRHRSFKNRNGMSFKGFIRTDGYSVSVLLQESEGIAGGRRKRGAPVVTDYFQDHIDEIKEDHLYIDPNRRDLLYCLGSNNEKLRYTSMQRRSETKAKLHEQIRTNIEVAAGVRQPRFRGLRPQIHTVNLPSRKTINIGYFDAYLRHFFLAMEEREEIYANPQFRKLKFSK